MFWIIILLIPLLVYYYLKKKHQYWEEKGVPYEKPWLLFGNMGRFTFRMISMQDELNELHGKFKTRYYGIYQFLFPTLMLKDPDLIKQITVKEFDTFVDHRNIISEESDPLFGKNLFSLRGQKWKDMRSTLSPAFTSSKMKSMYHLIYDCAEQFTDYFAKEVGTNDKKDVEMKDIFTRYSNDVIATCAFGIKVDSLKDQKNEFYLMGKDATNFSGSRNLLFLGFMMIPKLMNFFNIKLFRERTRQFFTLLVEGTMRAREEQNIVRPDMINLLMEAKKGRLKHEEVKNTGDTGFATVEESNIGTKVTKREWSDEDLTAQAVLFFIAGFDTISTMLSFCAHELAINVDVQEKLQAEIDDTLKDCNGKITYEAVMNMKYLDLVISEAMRKWPAAVITDRVCQRPFTIEPVEEGEKPVHLKQWDVVWIPIYCIHRDPDNYPNPEKFDPERFNDENKHKIKPFTYLPFGMGPRNCIGSRFALMEAKVIMCHLLAKFNLCVTEKTRLPLKISAKQFNPTAEGGFWLGLKKRTLVH